MTTARNKAILIIVLFTIALGVVATRIKVSTDLGLFLPEPVTQFEKLLRHQLANSASANIVFLAIAGLGPQQLADINKEIAQKLRSSSTFSKVTNNASSLSDSALAFLENNRYLLSRQDLSSQLSPSGLRESLQARLQGLASSSAAIEKQYLRNDPTGEIISLLEEWQGKISRHKRPEELFGVWFSEDHVRSLILVEIAADISKFDNQIQAIEEIRNILKQVSVPGLTHVITGPAAFAVESGEDIRADVKNLTLMAIFFVVLFLWCAYRSARMVFLVVCPLVMGVIVATAAILLIHGQVHGITLAFGVTLAGVAVDYPIHLLTGMGSNLTQDQLRITKIWRTLRLGVLSTVIAYAAFLVSGFGGLQQLGLFTIIGLISAALISRWLLPFLAQRRKTQTPGLIPLHNVLKRLGQSANKLRWLVVIVLLGSFTALWLTEKPILHLNVDSLSPIKDQRRAEGKMLRNDLGFWYGGSMMLVSANDKEHVLQASERIEPYLERLVEQGEIEGFDMAAHFLPSQKRQLQRKSEIGNIEVLQQNLGEALVDFPFRKKVFDPFIEQIKEVANMPLVTPQSLEDSTIGKKLTPLLFDFDGSAGGVVLLHGVKNDDSMRKFASEHDGFHFMHLKTASTDLVARSVDRVSVSILTCLVAIFFVLALAFKSITRPLKIMVPTLAAAVAAAAVLVFTGNPMSIFHLISLLLVVGLGLDYALFFNRLPDNSDEWDTTFRSLWVCGTTTILVFGILTVSQTPPLQAIGITVGIGAFMSMMFAAMWATTPDH